MHNIWLALVFPAVLNNPHKKSMVGEVELAVELPVFFFSQ
jgi:hypothetical protein